MNALRSPQLRRPGPAGARSMVHQRRSSSPAISSRFHTTHATPPSFHFQQIRQEIIQMWMMAESARGESSSIRARYCCFTYDDAVRAYEDPKAKWHWMDSELSSNLAGETGAVYIYRGALSALRARGYGKDDSAYDFVAQHMTNEMSHLRMFETVLTGGKFTVLVPVWKAAGWLVGYLPTMVAGTNGLYVTVEAVETFVEQHYLVQIRELEKTGPQTELLRMLKHCCEDEVHHKNDAADKLIGKDNKDKFDAWWIKPWSSLVTFGSTVAADIARKI